MKQISGIEARIDNIVAVTAAILLIGMPPSHAADLSDSSSQKESGWHFYMPTYVWAAGTRGTTSSFKPRPTTQLG